MADLEISYKGSKIVELSATGSKTLLTAGKYCEDDIEVEYTKSGGGSLSDVEVYVLDFINDTITMTAGAKSVYGEYFTT